MNALYKAFETKCKFSQNINTNAIKSLSINFPFFPNGTKWKINGFRCLNMELHYCDYDIGITLRKEYVKLFVDL